MPRLRYLFFDHKASKVRNSFEEPTKKRVPKHWENASQTSWQLRNSHQAKIANFKTLEPILKAPKLFGGKQDPFPWWKHLAFESVSYQTWFSNSVSTRTGNIIYLPGSHALFKRQWSLQWCGGWLGKFFERRINLHGGSGRLQCCGNVWWFRVEVESENVWDFLAFTTEPPFWQVPDGPRAVVINGLITPRSGVKGPYL